MDRAPARIGSHLMARTRPDVVYVHFGAARSYETASAIIRAGYSCRHLCGYYYVESGWLETLLRKLSTEWTGKIQRRLKRRYLKDLPPEAVERSWIQEGLSTARGVLRPLSRLLGTTTYYYADMRAAVRVLMLRPKIVIAGDSIALFTIRAAKRVGAISIVDQSTGHISAAARIMDAEKERYPDLASTYIRPAESIIRRSIKEVREADYIFAPSNYVTDTLLPLGVNPDRILHIPYGVDLDMFTPSAPESIPPFRILFAGRISMAKGVFYLLEAVRRAKLPGAQVVLLGNVLGDGEWLSEYQDLFVHISHLPHQEIPKIFAQAHIYVMPSLHEGSNISTYEAMASGLPVIATSNSGSVVRDGVDGFIVPIRDADKLRERIETLFNDPELRASMGDAGANRVADYSWETYSRRVGGALDTLLKDRDRA